MAKSEMTRAIEHAILAYHPAMLSDIAVNHHRGEHTALEVPVECGTTASGIIDAVRISEYFGNVKPRRICKLATWRKDGFRSTLDCAKGYDTTKPLPACCDLTSCRWNGVAAMGIPKVLITCFEIKVSKSDFKSIHGHNLVGNLNYYAMPKELYAQVEKLIPEGTGVLLYLHEGIYHGLRMKRRSTYKELTEEAQKWLILSTFKRVRNMDRQSNGAGTTYSDT